MLLILLALIVTVFVCVLAWKIAIFTFPVMVWVGTTRLLYHAFDVDLPWSIFTGFIAAVASLGLVFALVGYARHPALRLLGLALFAIPAGYGGFGLVYGIARHAFEISFLTWLLCSIAAVCCAVASVGNLTALAGAFADTLDGKTR